MDESLRSRFFGWPGFARARRGLGCARRRAALNHEGAGVFVLTLNLDIDNLTNEPQVFYRGFRDRIQSYVRNGVTMNFGVSGRF